MMLPTMAQHVFNIITTIIPCSSVGGISQWAFIHHLLCRPLLLFSFHSSPFLTSPLSTTFRNPARRPVGQRKHQQRVQPQPGCLFPHFSVYRSKFAKYQATSVTLGVTMICCQPKCHFKRLDTLPADRLCE